MPLVLCTGAKQKQTRMRTEHQTNFRSQARIRSEFFSAMQNWTPGSQPISNS